MKPLPLEQRSTRRFAVEDLDLFVDGERFEIVDVSTASVRFFHAGDNFEDRIIARLEFQSAHGAFDTFIKRASFVRQDQLSAVYLFTREDPAWHAFLYAHETLR